MSSLSQTHLKSQLVKFNVKASSNWHNLHSPLNYFTNLSLARRRAPQIAGKCCICIFQSSFRVKPYVIIVINRRRSSNQCLFTFYLPFNFFYLFVGFFFFLSFHRHPPSFNYIDTHRRPAHFQPRPGPSTNKMLHTLLFYDSRCCCFPQLLLVLATCLALFFFIYIALVSNFYFVCVCVCRTPWPPPLLIQSNQIKANNDDGVIWLN